jgi:hypothetical protein
MLHQFFSSLLNLLNYSVCSHVLLSDEKCIGLTGLGFMDLGCRIRCNRVLATCQRVCARGDAVTCMLHPTICRVDFSLDFSCVQIYYVRFIELLFKLIRVRID